MQPMTVLLIGILLSSGTYYIASIYAYRLVPWAVAICDGARLFCEQPRLLLATSIAGILIALIYWESIRRIK
jgi:hypothetical protein